MSVNSLHPRRLRYRILMSDCFAWEKDEDYNLSAGRFERGMELIPMRYTGLQ